MAKPVYDWTRPTDGVKFTWSPLTVGQEMDLEASYRTPEMRHLGLYALLAARLKLDGKQVEMTDLRSWETVDFKSLMEAVTMTEELREATLSKPSASSLGPVEQAWAKYRAASVAIIAAGDSFIAAARVAQATGPLGATP